MSWNKTYSHTVALGFDRLGAALIFNQPDVTISSLCWVVRNGHWFKVAEDALLAMKLSRWQLWLLCRIGDGLEHFLPGHCERARISDLQTGESARKLLSDAPPGYSYLK